LQRARGYGKSLLTEYMTQTAMKSTHHNMTGQHSRRVAYAGAGSRDAAVLAVAGAVVVLGTLFTTKQINPRWASGGLPRERNP